MAVAVKNERGVTTGPQFSPVTLSLLGVVYVLVSLGFIFKLLPMGWTWIGVALDMPIQSFLASALLLVLQFVLVIALSVFGFRLLGPKSPVGVRAGIFVGLFLLLMVLLLTRWVGSWAEYAVFVREPQVFSSLFGMVFVSVFAGLLLFGTFRLFTRRWMQSALVSFEQAGWFQPGAHKPSQGQRMRRATVLGVLLLAGAGVWTLLSQGTLRRGAADLSLAIPFTGKVALESFGDTRQWIADLTVEKVSSVEITSTPNYLGLRRGQVLPAEEYAQKVLDVASKENVSEKVLASLDKNKTSAVSLVTAVNQAIIDEIKTTLEGKVLPSEVASNLEVLVNKTDIGFVTRLREAFLTQMKNANRDKDLTGVFEFPTAKVLVHRESLDEINARTSSKENIKLGVRADTRFLPDYKEGDIVPTGQFESEVSRLRKEDSTVKPPDRVDLRPARGSVRYAEMTLLPNLEFTLPLLLIAVSLWFAWRLVNMPAFADFLIATEAELNKVSWPSQKRLVQDTIVVLVALVLMAGYLFVVDQVWRVMLSWEPVGVLVFPKDEDGKKQSLEQKRY